MSSKQPPTPGESALMETLVPDWAVSDKVKVHSTTRRGGVSQAPFESLNLGLHVADDPKAVGINRQRLATAIELPSEPNWLRQVHGSAVWCQRAGSASICFAADGSALDTEADSDVATADAAWTNVANHVVAVLTADCLPVVLATEDGSAVAVAHAGWRGLAAGVLDNTVSLFDESQSLHAWLGPAIGAQRFEVGNDVREAFVRVDGEHDAAFVSQGQGKYLADLYRLARRELQRRRPVEVTGGEHCTVTEHTLFHSYRRDGVASGRMATLAWITD